MLNNTKIRVPKKYEDMLREIDFEGRDSGYWAYSKEGFRFAGMDCHTAHEYNQKDLMDMIRTLEPCDCKECSKQEEVPSEEAIEVMFEEPIAGVSIVSDQLVIVIGERLAILEDGREVEQYIYHINDYTPENGKPFVSLKANIILMQ